MQACAQATVATAATAESEASAAQAAQAAAVQAGESANSPLGTRLASLRSQVQQSRRAVISLMSPLLDAFEPVYKWLLLLTRGGAPTQQSSSVGDL